MRELGPPPTSLVRSTASPFDVTRDVALGSFAGALPAVAWGAAARAAGHGALWQVAHDKRWIYVALRDGPLVVAAAVVRTGYAATALTWVWDACEPGFVDERVAMSQALAAEVVDGGAGARVARFEAGGLRIVIDDASMTVDALRGSALGAGVRAASAVADAPLHVRVVLEPLHAPPIAAVVTIDGGLASATQKHLAVARGEVVAGGRRRTIEAAMAAVDYTNGLLARRTVWRWALAMGRAGDGRRIALNLVQGFVGEAECALWVDDELVPVGEGEFELDTKDPMSPWRIRTQCGSVDLRFQPGAVHAQERDLVLVKSRFLQPAGRFTGTLRVRGVDLGPFDLLGVAEDQDVTW